MQQSAGAQQQNPHMVMKILWAALAATQFLLIFVCLNTPTPVKDPAANAEMMKYMLTAFAFGSLVMSYILPKMILKSIGTKLESGGQPIDSAPLEKFIQKMLPAMIVRWALLDSVTVTGFVLSFTSGDHAYVMAFAAVALVGFALTFPSERHLRGVLR